MIDPRFVYLAAAISVAGALGYIRDVLAGTTQPNRVTWGLWGVEGVLAFVVEVQQHVGTPALMTLMFGLIPLFIVAASFRHRGGVWRMNAFDWVCGATSLVGLVFWLAIRQSTVALVAFVAADAIAGLPTWRKAWIAPESETGWPFLTGVINTILTLLALQRVTTAGALFPAVILGTDVVIWSMVAFRLGPRFRQRVAVA